MASGTFNPRSANFQKQWTLLKAAKVYHAQVVPFLASLEVSNTTVVKFMRVFGRLTSLAEAWPQFNLESLQNTDPELRTFKEKLGQHYLQLAQDSITQRVQQKPAPLMLMRRNKHGTTVSVAVFSIDRTYPKTIDRSLQNALNRSDVWRTVNNSLMRTLVSLDMDCYPRLSVGQVFKEAERLDAGHGPQLDPPPSTADVVRTALVQLQLSCAFGVVEVEKSLHRPLLQRVATLLRWHLKVLRFIDNCFISEACVDFPAEIGELQRHVDRGLYGVSGFHKWAPIQTPIYYHLILGTPKKEH